MAIQDIITFLGKEVTFITHPEVKGSNALFEDLNLCITGVIEKIIISNNLRDVQIFVNNDWYFMSCVSFIKFLPNPAQV